MGGAIRTPAWLAGAIIVLALLIGGVSRPRLKRGQTARCCCSSIARAALRLSRWSRGRKDARRRGAAASHRNQFFLDRVFDQLGAVVYVDFAHEVVLVHVHGFHAEVEARRNFLH
jgi:hypothetical protein